MFESTGMGAAALLAGAVAACGVGLAWWALAMEVHWQQVRSDPPPPRCGIVALRALGSAALVASLLICLRVDHPTMAVLVWVMALAGGALVVAFMLAFRPCWLAPLVAWWPARRRGA